MSLYYMYVNKKAFTLIEAISTVVIMGILAAVVLPRFVKGDFIQSLALRTATTQIASDIRYARKLAIANSGHYLIKFDFSQKEYRIYRDSINPANQIGETKSMPSEITCSGSDQFDFYSLGNVLFLGEEFCFQPLHRNI